MDNDSLFSGMQEGPTREVAEFLRDIEPDEPHTLSMVIDAVIRLAFEVDRITPRVIDHDGGPTPGSVPVFKPLPDIELRYNALLVGLSELLNMIRYADDARATADATLTAVAARVAGMLDAHGLTTPANPPA